MSELTERIKSEILTAIENDSLVLPTLPEVALKVREIAEHPDSSIMDIVDVISNDAALTARIIRVCNSPLLRGAREIDNLNMAVSRLGMTYTSNLATGLAMEQMFQATSEVIDKKMRDVWQQSTEIAGISHVLTQHYTKLKADQATLAGLVHQIGVLPILKYVEDNDIDLNTAQLDEIINAIHPSIGQQILVKWDFPADLKNVPTEYVNFSRSVDKVDYADVVMVAYLQSLAGSEHPHAQMDWSTITAFSRLGLDPEIDISEAEDLSEDMEAAMALLNG
ncbi:signal transduction phosphohydrolase [Oleiphilus messinensis]|uniref:Signal transduction phosphohydrolase n=1 Tax=Oleiphilus messinensis TaxID=141451 RepID=A0A1Y0I796_9GAMM|nr:HDOD domain-containing protein [Oleiphilus messinensis]ARU55314.1 signal transduction phosphohydrolase [Oleiphilus messinensis]